MCFRTDRSSSIWVLLSQLVFTGISIFLPKVILSCLHTSHPTRKTSCPLLPTATLAHLSAISMPLNTASTPSAFANATSQVSKPPSSKASPIRSPSSVISSSVSSLLVNHPLIPSGLSMLFAPFASLPPPSLVFSASNTFSLE